MYRGRDPASSSVPRYGQGDGAMYGRSREAKALGEAIILTTPAPETMMMEMEAEEVREGGDMRGNQWKRALQYPQRRRRRNIIFWPKFS